MTAIPLEDELFYPESDDEPMAETELHLLEMIYVIEALRQRFENSADVYVGGNLLLYYQQGRRDAVVAPDVFVSKGVPKLPARRKYLLWEEGKAPCFALEVTSSSTRRKDVSQKKNLYEKLGIEEYFLFDPLGDYLVPHLQGYRLAGGRYRPLRSRAGGVLVSETLGLALRLEGTRLRLVDPGTGEPLLRHEEEAAARRKAENLVALEAARADRETARADREADRANREAARAQQEAAARRQAEERMRTLEAEIARLRQAQE